MTEENDILSVKKALTKDLVEVNDMLGSQIDIAFEEAEKLGCPPLAMRTTDGKWVIAPLLCAKAQVLSSLVLLEEM